MIGRTMRSRRAGSVFLLAFGIAIASGTARADRVDQLLEQAAPEVRTAIDAQPLAARSALSALLGRGTIDRDHLAQALGKETFAPFAVDTLTALARVDGIPGAGLTFERLIKAGDESGVRGAMFEILVAAALGDRVVAIGPTIDGNEVDLLLVDGTRVEVKNDAPDEAFKLSDSLASKGIKQLRKRGAFGDPVMLVANEPLAPDALASFRRNLGPTSEMLVLSNGRLSIQLARGAESRGQRARRLAVGRARRLLYRGKTRVKNAALPGARWLKRHTPGHIAAKMRARRAPAQAGR